MTYPYNNIPYGNPNFPYANQEVYVVNKSKKKNPTKAIIAGTITGAAAGGVIGFVKNR